MSKEVDDAVAGAEDHQPQHTPSRKRNVDQAELEVDLNAPEPPSKKALRKAKKAKSDGQADPTQKATLPPLKGAEDVVPNSGKRSEYGIWIGNLSFTTTKQDLVDFMTGDADNVITQDQITRINLPSGAAKHGKFHNKGFAYIDLVDSETLDKAVELSEKLLGGRRVLIKNAKSYEGRPADAAGKKDGAGKDAHPPSKRLFVGNLAFDTTVEDLEAHFEPCGSISNTHMATFEDSGKCKGYAWIEFEQLSSAQSAMRGWVEEGKSQEADGSVKKSDRRIWLHKLAGRKLRLEYAEDKVTRYQKRFGKDAIRQDHSQPAIEEVSESGHTETTAPDGESNHIRKRQSGDGKSRKVRENGYAKDTVQRLTGAIVEGKGSKVTFD